MIKAKDTRLTWVDVPIEGFIQKPPPVEAQIVELLDQPETQPLVEKVISLDEEVEAQSKEIEEETEEKSIESLIRDEDFEIFYHPNMTKDIASTSKPIVIAISEDQEAIEVPEAMVIEKKLLGLLSILESHAGGATPEVPVVPRPPTLTPPPPTQTKPTNKKWERDNKGGKALLRKGRFKKKLLLNKPRLPKLLSPNKRKEERLQRWFWTATHEFQAGILLWCWMEPPSSRIHQFVNLIVAGQATWPT